MKLTKYGWPQVVLMPLAIIGLMIVGFFTGLGGWLLGGYILVLFAVLVWALSFFRDPERIVPTDKNLLLAPADGTIDQIATVEEADFIGGRATCIAIFLSVFNVHINRAPCDVTVEKVIYKKGKFQNAMDPESARENESNDLWLTRSHSPNQRMILRQISGAIARHIVCRTKPEDKLAAGEKFGMIKFGSRTEIYLPARDDFEIVVKRGDKVKAGETILLRFNSAQEVRCQN